MKRAKFIGEQMKKDRTLRIDYQDLPMYGATRAGDRKQYKPHAPRRMALSILEI